MASSGILWSLGDFAQYEPERAAHLASAPPWQELVAGVRQSLRRAMRTSCARFALDESSRDATHLRGTIQFPIGPQAFDYLFNGHTGYRAQFRLGFRNGLTENDYLVAQLREELVLSDSEEVPIHLLSSEFAYKGSRLGSVGQIAETLQPVLSKVWVCEKLVELGGVRDLFVSRTGPKLTFDAMDPWSSLYPEDSDGWLDVKGAFMSSAGPYQLKSPEVRARNLEARGSA